MTVRRRLDTELVRRGLVESRARASELIAGGRVLVGGAPADRPARQVSPAEPIAVSGPAPRYVSRGGDKLDAALDAFPVDVAGCPALDVGASTGGFTDCLLQHGASHVTAVDVGHGQLAWSLRTDPRVTVREGLNARHLQPGDVGEPFPVAVADVSFISLLLLAPALHDVTATDAALVLLAKPQFEVGRSRVPRGGVVRDPAVHADVLAGLAVGLAEADLPVVDAVPSPLLGADGNREFLLYIRRGGTPLAPERVAAHAGSEA
jgi:23S rRNA (cytidine1920-2'-O)/16S rRNA (cytidine1409-2'-O)-methyltransferase